MTSPPDHSHHPLRELLETALRQHLGDPALTLLDYQATEPEHTGTSANNHFFQAKITYRTAAETSPQSLTWLIKQWQPGEAAFAELAADRPVEALGWQHGLLRPDALPPGVTTPFLGAGIAPHGQAAWVVMQDVAAALRRYDRARPLPAAELVTRAHHILAGLARLHVWGEQFAAQAQYDWLPSHENYLRRGARAYRALFASPSVAEPGEGGPVVTPADDNLAAFLDTLAPRDRSHWQQLLCHRRPLVDRLAGVPPTLLHNDLDDRNIGLTPAADAAEPELVLIDWEWMATGPAALDVAKLLNYLPGLCALDSPCPETLWTRDLPAYYFDRYRAEGGTALDEATWNDSYELALVAQALSPFPAVVGQIRRALDGAAPLPEYPGMPADLIRAGLAVVDRRLQAMTATLSPIMDRILA